MKSFWHRLGATDSVNLFTFIAVSYLQVLGAFIVAGNLIDGREVLFTAAVFVSLLPVAVTWLAGRYLLIPVVPASVRPWITLVIFEVSAILRGVTFDYTLVLTEFDSSEVWWRIYGSQATWLVGAVLISNLVVMARDFSTRNESLYLSTQALIQSRKEVATRLAARKAALTESIRTQLNSAVAGLDGSEVSKGADSLKSLIDDVVRPISNQLGREFNSSLPHEVSTPTARIQWIQVIRQSLADNPVHPLLVTAWISVGGLQLFTTIAGSNFFGPYVLALATYFLCYLGLWILWKYLPSRWGTTARAILFTGVSVLAAFLMNAFTQLLFGLNLFVPRIVIAEALYFLGSAWAIALVISTWRLLQRTNVELNAVNDELKRQFVQENSSARSFEHAVARVLHGPIQDAIAASLRRIQQHPPHATLSTSDLDDIRAPITKAILQLQQPDVPSEPLLDSLNDLASLWTGAVEIRSMLSPEADEVISGSDEINGIVVEILREAISNAIRHGDATTIEISIGFDADAQDIIVTSTNDGAPISQSATPGIGTKLLDDFAHMWMRENIESGVVLTAKIPTA